ncbi:MAG TPA: hypothetical protein VGJ07_17335 [Rugosimonospora sp.]
MASASSAGVGRRVVSTTIPPACTGRPHRRAVGAAMTMPGRLAYVRGTGTSTAGSVIVPAVPAMPAMPAVPVRSVSVPSPTNSG